jgi:hypothetical protein
MWNLRRGKQAVAHTVQNSSGVLQSLRKSKTCLNNQYTLTKKCCCLRRNDGMQVENNSCQILSATTIN